MSREQRGPNEKLGAVLALAGISNAGLARRVNDLGAQRGLTLRYDKTSVARWVSKGMVPQGAAPHLIAAAIGQKLGRPVPLHEIGLADADPAPEVGLAFPRDVGQAVRSATELYRLDLAGRRAGGGIWQSLAGSFAVSAYATPASRWLITPADSSVAREASPAEGSGAPLKVGHSDVQKLREAAEDARRWDSKYGGGDWRSSMVPECLRVEAAPLLLGSYSDEVGRALFGASAELTRLAGWMAFDTGQQEAAQRYYIQALRLARAAADVPLGGYVLASMSLQATYRGFGDEGVDLAQAALERNRGLATARTMSFFRLVEARAHARANDAVAAGAALKAAELAGARPPRRQRPVVAGFLLLRPVRRRRGRVLPRPEGTAPGPPFHRAGAVEADGGVRTLARPQTRRLGGGRAGVGQSGRGLRAGRAGGRGGRPHLLGPHHRVREGPPAPP